MSSASNQQSIILVSQRSRVSLALIKVLLSYFRILLTSLSGLPLPTGLFHCCEGPPTYAHLQREPLPVHSTHLRTLRCVILVGRGLLQYTPGSNLTQLRTRDLCRILLRFHPDITAVKRPGVQLGQRKNRINHC